MTSPVKQLVERCRDAANTAIVKQTSEKEAEMNTAFDELESALSAQGEAVACESDRAGRCLACGGTGGHDEGCRGCRCPVCLPYAAPPESKWIPEAALHALRNYEQADEPGVMVLVSREALDLAIAALTPKVKP